MAKLSVLLPCYNNERIIRDCLESVKWADEILVVDSFSTDGTLQTCREYTNRIIQHEYINSAAQKNWAIPQCTHEWILQVDSDETLEPGLAEEICEAIAAAPPEVHAFHIPTKSHALGVWIKALGIYPDYHERLFRKSVGRFEERDVHAHVLVPGKIGILKHHILHYGMPSLSKPFSNLDRYTRYESEYLWRKGTRFRWDQVSVRPCAVFLYYYFWKKGCTAGFRGFFLSAYFAIYSFLKYSKLWEMEWRQRLRK